ncbi:hypothetical protein [Prochlorococcus marinus]|uniref:Protein family PM-12 n=1 Tax=Prochlorococcus marinus (strain AS9601) TaxID=146891 RepID=A2BT00_PROMS|nr:hypothetical protein [Prochlorococcus marinus]ABM70911.1 Hypothetical protein A9601_16281 [Prochlorococcus marinus str. AS9601]
MTKRHQLNINIDEALLKQLKLLALSEDLALSVFIRNSLRKIVSSKKEDFPNKKNPFSEMDALNCTNFMRAIFQKKRVKKPYSSDLDAFNELLTYIESSKQWTKDYTKRLREILLDDSNPPWNANELNAITRKRECECPIYLGLKDWTGCNEYPSQDLICNLGGSLVLLIENQI